MSEIKLNIVSVTDGNIIQPNQFTGNLLASGGAVVVPIPGNFTATVLDQSIRCQWSAVPSATYRLEISTDGTSFTTVANTAVLQATASSLTNGVTYYFRVFAIQNGTLVESDPSPVISATPQATPAVPTTTGTTIGNLSITLTWTPVPGREYVPLIALEGDSLAPAAPRLSGSSYTFTGLTDSVSYDVSVMAINPSTGQTSSPAPVSTVTAYAPPAAPSILTNTLTPSGINLTWSAVSGCQYRVYYGPSLTSLTAYGSLQAGTSISMSALNPGQTYFVVRAKSNVSGLFSANSTPLFTTIYAAPAAPTGVTLTPFIRGILISWTDPAQTSHQVYWGLTVGSQTNTIPITSGSSSRLENIDPQLTYYFKVVAISDVTGFSSIASSVVSANPLDGLLAPSDLSPTPGNGQIDLVWTEPTYHTNVRYSIQYRNTTTGGGWVTAGPYTSGTTSTTLSSLSNGDEYEIQIRTESTVSSTVSAWSTSVFAITLTPLLPPTGLVITVDGSTANKAIAAWTDAGDDVDIGFGPTLDVNGYVVVTNTVPGLTTDAGGLDIISSVLSSNPHTYFTIRSKDGIGTSAWATTELGWAAPPLYSGDFTNPDTPANLALSCTLSGTVTLTWDAVDYCAYTVEYRQTGNTAWLTWPETNNLTTTINGLFSTQSYDFRVKARNKATNLVSTPSSIEQITPTASAPTIEFAAPTSSGPTPGTVNVILTRTGNTGATSTVGILTSGTAVLNTDYTKNFTTSATFGAGETTKTLVVSILPGATAGRTVIFTLSGGSNNVIGTEDTHTVTVAAASTNPSPNVTWPKPTYDSTGPQAPNDYDTMMAAATSGNSVSGLYGNLTQSSYTNTIFRWAAWLDSGAPSTVTFTNCIFTCEVLGGYGGNQEGDGDSNPPDHHNLNSLRWWLQYGLELKAGFAGKTAIFIDCHFEYSTSAAVYVHYGNAEFYNCRFTTCGGDHIKVNQLGESLYVEQSYFGLYADTWYNPNYNSYWQYLPNDSPANTGSGYYGVHNGGYPNGLPSPYYHNADASVHGDSMQAIDIPNECTITFLGNAFDQVPSYVSHPAARTPSHTTPESSYFGSISFPFGGFSSSVFFEIGTGTTSGNVAGNGPVPGTNPYVVEGNWFLGAIIPVRFESHEWPAFGWKYLSIIYNIFEGGHQYFPVSINSHGEGLIVSGNINANNGNVNMDASINAGGWINGEGP